MTNMKKSLALALCLVVLFSLTACFGGEGGGLGGLGGNVTYGRYVEEDITPPDMKGNVRHFYFDETGVMDITTSDYSYEEDDYDVTYYRYRSTDNAKTWQSLDMGWTEQYKTDYSQTDEYGNPLAYVDIGNISVLPDGGMLAVISRYDYVNEQNTNELLSIDMNGNPSKITIPLLEELMAPGVNAYIYNIDMLDETRMVLNGYAYESDGIGSMAVAMNEYGDFYGVFDINTGEQLVDFYATGGWNIFYSDDAFYMETESGEYEAYSLTDGSRLEAELPESELMYKNNIWPSDSSSFITPDNEIFAVNSKGVVKIAAGMEEPELIMEGLNYSYGSPTCWVSNMYLNGEEILLAASDDSDGPMLLRFTWDPKAPATSDQHLTVYSLYDNDTARLALSQFKKQHPEVTVSFEAPLNRDNWYDEDGSAMTAEDALRALSTELLAGSGPDVLILDDLPLQSYIDKGVLADIGDVLDGLDLNFSVIDPMRSDKGTFAVPCNYTLPLLFAEKDKLGLYASFDDLLNEIEKGPLPPAVAEPDYDNMTDEEWQAYWEERDKPRSYEERPVMRFDSLDELVSIFYETSAPAIYTEAGGLDKAALSEYLQAVKRVSDTYGLYENIYSESAADSYIISMGGTSYSHSSSLSYYGQQQARTGYTQLTSLYSLTDIAYSQHYASFQYIEDDEGNYVETPREDFKKLESGAMLAPGLAEGVYFPRNIAGVCSTSKQTDLAKEFVATMLGYDVQRYNFYYSGLPVNNSAFQTRLEEASKQDKWMRENDIKPMDLDFDALSSQFATPYFTNEYLLQIIFDNTLPYCKGSASLEATVEAIASETEIYFAERQ